MKRKAPIIRQYMTRLPVEAERCEHVGEAIKLMRSHGFHHIPVMNGPHLKGIVSDQDILQARIQHGKRLEHMTLEEICRLDVLTVTPIEPLDEVVRKMLDQKADCAVVVDGGFVVGIFTAVDAMKALRDVFGAVN